MPLKTANAHTGWVAVSVWMSFASSPSMYVVSFSPTVTLSTMSWFCCRSWCRPVISWCRVSLLPLELRRPSARTQSPWKLPSPPRRLFQLVTKASQHLHYQGFTLMTLCINPRTQTVYKSSWWDTHVIDIWQFHCRITLKTVCYQPYWKASAWVSLCTLHSNIVQ